MQDESGLNPGTNEVEPLVAGSRGGFGLAQWTGPRRRELEAFAASRGMPPSDMDTQLDFLMTELGGSEATAARSILSATDTATAAQAILNDFLRPSEEHRARRAKQYAALADPWLSDTQRGVLQGQIAQEDRRLERMEDRAYQQWAQQNDPLRQIQIRTAQTKLDQMQEPQSGYMQQTGAELGLSGPQADMLFNVAPDGKITQIGGSRTNIILRNEGTIPQGYRAVRDQSGNLTAYEPVPGGPADTPAEREEAEQSASRNAATRTSVVSNTTSRMRDLLNSGGPFDLPEVGVVGNMISGFNQEAADMRGMIETLKGMVAFDRIEKLKEASASGSTGLGPISNIEIGLLGAQLGALDQSLSRQQLLQTLDTIENTFGRMSPAAQAFLTGASDSLPSSLPPPPDGFLPEEWQHFWDAMPEEDRELFR